MTVALTSIGPCHGCGGWFTFCPRCVHSINIDPQTDRPPRPESRASTERRVICDQCVNIINRMRPLTSEITTSVARHERHNEDNHGSVPADISGTDR